MTDRTLIAALLLASHAKEIRKGKKSAESLVDTAIDLADLLLLEMERRTFNEQTSPREESHDED